MTEEILLLYLTPVVVSILALIACWLWSDLIRERFKSQLSLLLTVAFVIPGLYGTALLAWNLSGSVLAAAAGVIIGSAVGHQLSNLVERLMLRFLDR